MLKQLTRMKIIFRARHTHTHTLVRSTNGGRPIIVLARVCMCVLFSFTDLEGDK